MFFHDNGCNYFLSQHVITLVTYHHHDNINYTTQYNLPLLFLSSRTIIIFTSIHQGHLHINSCSISSYLLTFVAITTITMVINYSNDSNLGLSLFSIMLSIIADCNSTSYYHNTNIIKSMLILHTVELMSSLESLSCCHDKDNI